MLLKRLLLRNFRSHKHLSLEFSPNINWIYGENGSGKTNLLEAIYLLSTGRSFRTRRLQDLIYQGETFFSLEATFEKEGVLQNASLYFSEKERIVHLNQTKHVNLGALFGLLPIVFFGVQDERLITGAPEERRRFLNLHIGQTDPSYVHHLFRYHKALKQRNCLLKKKLTSQLAPWEQTLALSASCLIKKRINATNLLQKQLSENLKKFSPKKANIEIAYQSSLAIFDDFEKIVEQYNKVRKREIYLGATLMGPHRDDIKFLLSGKEARSFASEGQKRSILMALHLSEWQAFEETLGYYPLFCLDDAAIHLDEEKQAYFFKELEQLGQVFFTSTAEANPLFLKKKLYIPLSST